MSKTHFSGPLKTGTVKDGLGVNVGDAVLMKKVAIDNAGGPGTFDFSLGHIPANAEILDILIDVETAWDSVTSAILSVGKSGAVTHFASGVDVKTTGRKRPTFTAAQLTNMQDVGAPDVEVLAQIVTVGAGVAGVGQVTLIYAQH